MSLIYYIIAFQYDMNFSNQMKHAILVALYSSKGTKVPKFMLNVSLLHLAVEISQLLLQT